MGDPVPRVTVVVPARNAEATLGRTLAALRGQDFGLPFEVIVVDDGSQDQTAAIAEQWSPFVTLIRSPSAEGPGAARNRGARVARAPVLAFTDADCFPSPGWLVNGLESIKQLDIVQGAVRPDPSARRSPFDRTLVVDGDGGFYQTANLLVRREIFDAVGGFRDWTLEPRRGQQADPVDLRRRPTKRTPPGEDALFAWSARRLGARTGFAADAPVFHAVLPGSVVDEIARRWHWTREMPGLAGLVPELRGTLFYRRWFFHRKTARFDCALLMAAVALARRRKLWLVGVVPYVEWVRRDAGKWPARDAVKFALGSVAVDAVTFAGLLIGSARWRSLLV